MTEDKPKVIDSDDLRTAIDNLLFEIEINVHDLMNSLKRLKESSKEYDFTDLKVFRASLVLLEIVLFALKEHYTPVEKEEVEA